MNSYETDRSLSEYLLFHYGTPEEILPWEFGPCTALSFPVRTVTECLRPDLLAEGARGLDLGCAVGRSAFELTRFCREVIAVDYSAKFIAAAQALGREGRLPYEIVEQGEITLRAVAEVPAALDRGRAHFEVGDAVEPRADLGCFDVVHMANLIDRLADPAQCLSRLPERVRPGGQLIITSPYTWMEEFTPKQHWLGGRRDRGVAIFSGEVLRRLLAPTFELLAQKDLPFLIREHRRKYQWSVAEATVWRRL